MTSTSTSQPPANVLIVEDDQPFADDFISPHFEDDWRVKVAYNVPQSLEALESIVDLRLAIVDLDLPGAHRQVRQSGGAGFEVIESINRKFPRARVVVLTAYLTPELVNRAQALNAEYVSKSDCYANLNKIAEELWHAELRPTTVATAETVEGIASQSALTERQKEVLLLLVDGYSRNEIVQKLNVSHWTLKAHVGAIIQKTGSGRMQELVLSIRKRAG